MYVDKKEINLIYALKETCKNIATTESVCSKCEINKTYYKEKQIRSAVEPITIFYKCTKCGYEWREG